ncbi:MAG: hypothetical protein H6983_18575 [Ectothiorhodospiraceae bacterium]|nr:hypothetical protein [Ectothiorhodospiraceae bacterium]
MSSARTVAWGGIFALALVLQVVPLLLVCTMVGLAFGFDPTAAFAMIPLVVLGTTSVGCWVVARRRRARGAHGVGDVWVSGPRRSPDAEDMTPHRMHRLLLARFKPWLLNR